MDNERADEIERLWRAVKRDYFGVVVDVAGLRTFDQRRFERLRRNWIDLCKLDGDLAAHLAHGFEEVDEIIQRPGGVEAPFDRNTRTMAELVGVARIGRHANPDADVQTLGELVQLGEEVIAQELEAIDVVEREEGDG